MHTYPLLNKYLHDSVTHKARELAPLPREKLGVIGRAERFGEPKCY